MPDTVDWVAYWERYLRVKDLGDHAGVVLTQEQIDEGVIRTLEFEGILTPEDPALEAFLFINVLLDTYENESLPLSIRVRAWRDLEWMYQETRRLAMAEQQKRNGQAVPESRPAVERVRGKFAPGVSGNPGGRPKDVERVRALALEKSPGAVKVLDEIAHDKKQPGRTRVAASQVLLDHGVGRPATVVVDEDGERLEIVVKTVSGKNPWPDDPLTLPNGVTHEPQD